MTKYFNTGCPECDRLPGAEMCLEHQLEFADYQVDRWMKIREELEKKKEKKDAINLRS